MKSFRFLLALAAVAAVAAYSSALTADYNELLGERSSTAAGETERIRVGRALGGFWGVIIETGNPAPVFERIVVHYQEGGHEVVENPDVQGEFTIGFHGKSKKIDRVELTYGEGPERATFRVLGMKTRPDH